ncbi:sugar ABC transporter ATP-binding protein [Corynebacterium sp. sy017]|uniref:sugar ABC transporter ATP-binding protein n=1 Tax=unclassified Corynebacterium TaxID=2624378 RepID=UPI001186AEF7|nr:MULTISPECIES: sugar ABC transporter ATP-binding protein [unclassified Corynebacterium]MBP3088280.1 sugar ABC transporter ATP-binding protein [Corynebacterium sp. sy017]QDZ41738.1 sugar ABC transporter ATP-binding protein [Corynebacterium sp. sy039]TSD91605.1 sugar ABC transporter ATP-binding protein [Corynebacterium sp. SY003]
MSDVIMQLEGISKSFGAVNVIDNVSLAVRRGQVQALLGENGAGKSTLIKMMSGVYQPDAGKIIVDGNEVTLPNTKAAEALGIATIHQELNLVPSMTVAENIMLGRTPSRWGLVNYTFLKQQAAAALRLIGLDVSVDTPVGELGIARQQLVEIAKALSMNARMLILDEPTAALTAKETDQLFNVLEQLRDKGVGMVFISHHLEELARLADSISVLRDGHFIAEVPATTPEDELVRLMVGRDIEQQYPRITTQKAQPVLEIKNLSAAGKFHDINIKVHAGEVVGIAGLVGAGRTELIRAIAGADTIDSGKIVVNGKTMPLGNIAAAIKAGIGHVPEDRKAQGLILDASINENLGLTTLSSSARYGLADRRGQKKRAQEVAKKLKIRMADIDQPISDLSGGNQQKAVFAKWVLAGSTVLLLDEPTRGVDVGARVEIYNIINDITAAGGAVLMVSSDLPEVLGMSDRIVVMSDGRIAGELPNTASQDEIMTLAVANLSSAVIEENHEAKEIAKEIEEKVS